MCSIGRQESRSGRCLEGRYLALLVSTLLLCLLLGASAGTSVFRSQPEALDLWKLVRRLFCKPPVRSVAVESSVLHLCRADSAVLQCRKDVLHRRRAVLRRRRTVLHGRKAVLHRRRAVLHVRKAVALSAASDLWDICSCGSARAEKAFVCQGVSLVGTCLSRKVTVVGLGFCCCVC